MSDFHDETDSLRQLVQDAEDEGHNPHSVRVSALEELRKRGFRDREDAMEELEAELAGYSEHPRRLRDEGKHIHIRASIPSDWKPGDPIPW